MTWAQWVASSYNTGGFSIVGNSIVDTNGTSMTFNQYNTYVSQTDIIQDGHAYYLPAGGSSQ